MRRLLPLVLLGLTACPGIGSDDNSVLPEVPERPTYAEVAQISATYCLRCHNQSNAQGEYDGDTYETLFARRDDAAGVVDSGIMPPLNEPPMSKVDRETFLKWVEIGAPRADLAD